jgi:hypothetical protein
MSARCRDVCEARSGIMAGGKPADFDSITQCFAKVRVDYLPAESNTGMFGGNSNWRGPIWMPINALIIRALLQFYTYYGDNFRIERPTGSGKMMNLFEVSKEIAARLQRIFCRDDSGRRLVYCGTEKFQSDPHWRDNVLFYEYFHGDNGAGLGASHQTGWTGVVAKLIHELCEIGRAGAYFDHLWPNCKRRKTRWRSELNSNSRETLQTVSKPSLIVTQTATPVSNSFRSAIESFSVCNSARDDRNTGVGGRFRIASGSGERAEPRIQPICGLLYPQ